ADELCYVCREKQVVAKTDATALCHGHSRWSLNRSGARFLLMPRARPVVFTLYSRFILLTGGNVKHHGASPWDLAKRWINLFSVAANMTNHRASLWYRPNAAVHHLCFTYFSWRTDLSVPD